MTGSYMSMVNALCNPCTVPVTGYISLDDDLGGNISLSYMNLSHNPYEVANPMFVSVMIDRDLITQYIYTATGTGTTVNGNAVFGATTLDQVGTVTCGPALVNCLLAGLPVGATPLPSSVNVNLGSWAFDLAGNLSASFIYTSQLTPQPATETLVLVGTPSAIPEPGTGFLIMAGLVGIALRRRAGL